MAWDDLVRVKLDDGSVTSVGRAFAEAHEDSVEILTDDDGNELPATNNGLTIPPEFPPTDDDGKLLRGEALDEALTAAGLATSGKVGEKQKRLAEYQAANPGA